MDIFATSYLFKFTFGCYLAATGVQLAVWWFIFNKLSRPQTIPEVPSRSPCSVLLCARNEAENLRRFLPAILTQEYDAEWELLVVNDASTDDTAVVLQGFQEQYPDRIRVLQESKKTRPGKKQALAQGIAAAKYEFLLLTDADCQPASPHWLAHMMAALTAKPETEIVLGYGPNFAGGQGGGRTQTAWSTSSEEAVNTDSSTAIPVHVNDGSMEPKGSLNAWFRFETAFIAAQYCSFALAGHPYMGVGRNLAFKRAVYERVGGFAAHVHLVSGDDDLLVNAAANRHNTVICLVPDSFVYSAAPNSLRAWLQQKQRHLSASPAYRWQHKWILGGWALSQLGHYLLFVFLILSGIALGLVWGIFLLRLFSVWLILGRILRMLREQDLIAGIPFLEWMMVLNHGMVVPWLLAKQAWQNFSPKVKLTDIQGASIKTSPIPHTGK